MEGTFYDGNSVRSRRVRLRVRQGVAYLDGEASRVTPVHHLQVREQRVDGIRHVVWPDGAYMEVSDLSALRAVLAAGRANGVRRAPARPLSERLARLALVLALLTLAWLRGLPWLTDSLARHVDAQTAQTLGAETLASLDHTIFQPSALAMATRQRLQERFARLAAPLDLGQPPRLVFRGSVVGPNAYALPGNVIVLTDGLVLQAGEGARGLTVLTTVLAHELGHLQHSDATVELVRSQGRMDGLALAWQLAWSGSTATAGLLLPDLLLDLQYPAETEHRADAAALALMHQDGWVTDPYVQFVQGAASHTPYAHSHTLDPVRVARLGAADGS